MAIVYNFLRSDDIVKTQDVDFITLFFTLENFYTISLFNKLSFQV